MLQTITPKTSYLIARAVTTAGALAFAFIYSKALGLGNRSVVTFVMTSNALIWVLLTSGTTLTLRKLTMAKLDARNRASFNSLIAIQASLAVVIFVTALQLYSLYKNFLTPNFLIGALIYFLLSGSHLILLEILLASNNFKLAGYLDIFTISLQISFFTLLNLLTSLSISVCLFFSLTLSYLVISIIVIKITVKNSEVPLGFKNPFIFLRETKGNHSLGIALGIMDRIDRFLIGIALPTIILGKYAVMSGIISVFRFFPNALSKIIISKTLFSIHPILKQKLLVIILTVLCGSLLVTFSQLFIRLSLGNEWLLPTSISICFVIQEFFRGLFEISANRSVALGRSHLVHKLSLQLPFLAIGMAILLMTFVGVIGVPIAFSFSFIVLLLISKFRTS